MKSQPLRDGKLAGPPAPGSGDQPIADNGTAGARQLAANDVGAVIAHQLVEPLTALLLYMHELNWTTNAEAAAAPGAARALAADALRETQRICSIIERIGNAFEASGDSAAAVAAGRDAQAWWTRCIETAGDTPTPTSRTVHHRLTPREREVLSLISAGSTNKEGALRLHISPRTYETHRAQIMRKLGARNAADLLRKVLVEAR